jgi:hypothetical protein
VLPADDAQHLARRTVYFGFVTRGSSGVPRMIDRPGRNGASD